jgi:hypothetical protein
MSLLLAVWPLCRVRSDLQDFVVMLLRKMMYRQDVDGRWGMCTWRLQTALQTHNDWQQQQDQPVYAGNISVRHLVMALFAPLIESICCQYDT